MTPFKVGSVVLLGLLMAILMIVKFSANWGQSDGSYELHAYFDDVTGLAKRSRVLVAGIQIGEVQDITLENNKAKVTINIRESVEIFEGIRDEQHFKNGAVISKKMSGIMGNYHLELTPGVAGKQLVDGDEIINVLQGGGPEALLRSAEKIFDNVVEVTDSLSNVLGGKEGEERFVKMMDDVNESLSIVRQLMAGNQDRISSIIVNVEDLTANAAKLSDLGNGEIPKLIETLDDVLLELKETLGSTRTGVDGTLDSAQDALIKLSTSIDKLDRSLSNIQDLTDRMNRGEGSVGKLLNDNAIANETESLLKETRELIKSTTETVENANALIKPISDLDVDISMRSDYLVNANAFRIDFGVKLQPSFDKYYLLNVIMDPNGSTQKVSTLTESSLTGPVYETVTTRTNDIKFSAQFAKRWRWFVGRFGIIENTGGIGGDVLLFDDNLRFGVDLFAFNTNEYVRIRGTLLLYFSVFMPWEWAKTFYVSAGFDDPINPRSFDYFFGLGFRFTDNDIKSLMSLIPKP